MIYFSDFFNISEAVLDKYGALDISLINDLPLFIDPFLLFGSSNPEYQQLHKWILEYLSFLKGKAQGPITKGSLEAWYFFPEEKQNWLGYCVTGNAGSGLGRKFADGLSGNINVLFADLGNERISDSSHLEKACLFQTGVGRDNISDFACNLIKSYLLEYTEKFALTHLEESQRKRIPVKKAYFDYNLERWMPKHFVLPFIHNDYIILTPKDLLTKDEVWINNNDLYDKFEDVCAIIPNTRLRAEINNYFYSNVPAPKPGKSPTKKDKAEAITKTVSKYADIIDYYIKFKEANKDGAKKLSAERLQEVRDIFVTGVNELVHDLQTTEFYKVKDVDSYEASIRRVQYLKQVIEDKDGYRLFYHKGKPLKREADLQVIFRLTWYASIFDVNREVNNGRGPVDYAVSKGSKDKTLVEFKLASNSSLKKNLENQVKIYEKASDTKKSIKVIMYFDQVELSKINSILNNLDLVDDKSIILIDAGNDKQSASRV